jgi:hypothetical protein
MISWWKSVPMTASAIAPSAPNIPSRAVRGDESPFSRG